MSDYTVTWVINIFGVDNPRDAALEALEIQRAHDSTALVFSVEDEENNTTTVDLWEEEDE